MPSAETRIRIPYAAVPCASVTTIALEDLEKDDPRVAGALPAGFSLILGLVVFDTKLSIQQVNKHLGNGDTEEHGQRTERRLAAKWIRKSNKHALYPD